MEFKIMDKDGAYPCVVTVDPENGRYMIRNADTSGESFSDGASLLAWVKENWQSSQFEFSDDYTKLLQNIEAEIN
ncbi:hypothetical protein [Bacillus suaedae]|uniref:Threonine dehydratase n=1 Tax=Halalkalibacter suaedae TaxID=2822140 RepID=A0A940WV20_9BACI|nr:hypothetical protein [Bacillus suaedae]MBP3952955.1 hypothetical protein [Bacillus suaedae]